MTIQPQDIKLLESQRLTDNEDGGGRATGNQVVSGDVNNLFEDISRIDRTTGDVALRKVFVGVHTDNVDRYLGAHVILTDAPADEHVSAVLFNTESQTDQRSDAQDRIESYVVKSTTAPFYPLGNQLVGQRSLLLFQRDEERIPEVGEVFVIYNETTGDEQYIRATKVTYQNRVFFTDFHGSLIELNRREVVMELAGPLEMSYPGGEPDATGVTGFNNIKPAKFLSTQVADSARYFGVKKLSADVLTGSLEVKVPTVYENIVPSATSETPLADQDSNLGRLSVVQTGPSEIGLSWIQGTLVSGWAHFYIGGSVLPGSVRFSAADNTIHDNGDGTMTIVSGTWHNKAEIDYESGTIRLQSVNAAPSTTLPSLYYTPAAPKSGRIYSSFINVTIQNRQYNYTLNLADAPPHPGSLVVEYMALGKWVQLRDNGAGSLIGQGSGTINYVTGSVIITTAALPDADTPIVYSFLSQEFIRVDMRTSLEVTPKKKINGFLEISAGKQILKGSVTFTWTGSNGAKTATDEAGKFAGDAEGRINYITGEYELSMDYFPIVASEMNVEYEEATALTGTFTYTPPPPPPDDEPEVIDTTVPTGNQGNISIGMPDGETLTDDGNGNLTGNQGSNGTVDYGTGAVRVVRNNKTIKITGQLTKSVMFYAHTWFGGSLQKERFTGNGNGTWTGDLGHSGSYDGGSFQPGQTSNNDYRSLKVKIPYLDGSGNQVFLTVTIETSYVLKVPQPGPSGWQQYQENQARYQQQGG